MEHLLAAYNNLKAKTAAPDREDRLPEAHLASRHLNRPVDKEDKPLEEHLELPAL